MARVNEDQNKCEIVFQRKLDKEQVQSIYSNSTVGKNTHQLLPLCCESPMKVHLMMWESAGSQPSEKRIPLWEESPPLAPCYSGKDRKRMGLSMIIYDSLPLLHVSGREESTSSSSLV